MVFIFEALALTYWVRLYWRCCCRRICCTAESWKWAIKNWLPAYWWPTLIVGAWRGAMPRNAAETGCVKFRVRRQTPITACGVILFINQPSRAEDHRVIPDMRVTEMSDRRAWNPQVRGPKERWTLVFVWVKQSTRVIAALWFKESLQWFSVALSQRLMDAAEADFSPCYGASSTNTGSSPSHDASVRLRASSLERRLCAV